tara:strand:- start:1197 stop:2168 length:972 start_codon:yes stop_codon:yes gene_type:complete
MNPKYIFTLVVYCLLIINQSAYAQKSLHQSALEFFSPLPTVMPGSENDAPSQVVLGKKLFFETALSINNNQSCNSCHNLKGSGSGAEKIKVSIGSLGKKGTRNSPTVWNAGLQVAQFWDGKAKTLEQQAKFPLLDPNEMAMPSEEKIIEVLENRHYLPLFKQAYPAHTKPINMQNIAYALAAFQRTLISRDRFDDYLKGNLTAISEEEKKGLRVFIEIGCVACHNGSVIGGQLFMKMGLVNPYPNKVDLGKGGLTGNSADNYFFKVPSLRNVLNTPPYFHDGAAVTIEQAIIDTGWHQLGINIDEKDVQAIKTFFNTLNHKKR